MPDDRDHDVLAEIQADLEAEETAADAAAEPEADPTMAAAEPEADLALAAEEPATGVESAGFDMEPPATVHSGAPEIDMGPEKAGGPWLWVFGLLGLLAVAAAGYALWYFLLSPVEVPNAVGKHLGQATQALNDAEVRLGRISTEPTTAAPPGTVIDQDPAAGAEVDRGSEIAFVVAGPPEVSSVPDVTGHPAQAAQRTLVAQGLGALLVETYDTTVAAGNVISQLPTAGVELAPGTLVALAVSKGASPTSVSVPDLRNVTPDEAEKILAALDLVGVSHRSFDASASVGDIAAQLPAPGSKIAARSAVQYLISEGRPPSGAIAVPNITSQTEQAAKTRLQGAGLKAKVSKATHATIPAGTVISQLPRAGARIPRDAEVSVLVSRGADEQLAVPSLVGTGTAEADKTLSSAGFRPVMLAAPMTGAEPGQVYAQWPAASALWPQHFPVILIYAE